MANSTFEILELRIVVEPELTHLYVLCGRTSDGTLGVQGWHRKTIPASAQPGAIEILAEDVASGAYLTSPEWSPAAPS